ncbi:response regulator [Thalassolituus sp. LLYu03]|uniref:response regulator n=1 Tax=Thalassolituus sp. LLYu03 TaxID=3421656 RepID=UPI003D299AE6
MSAGRIALLDDEYSAVALLSRVLADYDLDAFISGQTFTQQVNGQAECILLDIQMPEISGYDICRALRARADTRNVPILFISGQTSIDDRLAGYAAGADDFIAKPFDVDELRAKVARAVQHRRLHNELLSSMDDARQAAFEAMTHSAEQGEITRFIEQAMVCQSEAEVARTLINTLGSFGLNAVVAVWGAETAFWSHAGEARPLEQELMVTCREAQRIVAMERRLLINYPRVSLLIKNTPWQEAARYGRIKDHLCVLMSGADARLGSLETEQRFRQQHMLLMALDDVQKALEGLQLTQHRRLQLADEAVQELDLELSEELALLNLDPDQERHLHLLVQRHVAQLGSLYHDSADVGTLLAPVLLALSRLAGERDDQILLNA